MVIKFYLLHDIFNKCITKQLTVKHISYQASQGSVKNVLILLGTKLVREMDRRLYQFKSFLCIE